MKIVFFGSSEFAVPSLRALIEAHHEIPYVITQADKKSGRGLHLSVTPVKDTARQLGLEVYQPGDIRAAEVESYLRNLSADLFVVIAYGRILPQDILDIPKFFSINVHASLLPKYRGAAPINWAIIRGEKTTGVTVIKMDSSMDTGAVISQKKALISDADTAQSLGEKLSKIGSELLIDTIKLIENNKFKLTPQIEPDATFASKMKKEDGLIDWGVSAKEIFNLIRGCFGWPGAFTYYKGKLLKIYKARIGSRVREWLSPRVPGEVIDVSKEGIVVAAGTGNLVIQELQIEGKRLMKIEEFALGHKIKAGDILIRG
ncbi:MAG: methionyl-tRNA formyltransferase [Candidatus Omnitrophota bacterium]|jgi:methionyl-tRNA formyltransferase